MKLTKDQYTAIETAINLLPEEYPETRRNLRDILDSNEKHQRVSAYRLFRRNIASGEWVLDGRPWCDGEPSADLLDELRKQPDTWRIEVAYSLPQPMTVPFLSEKAEFQKWFDEETKNARYNGESINTWPAKEAWMYRAEIERNRQKGLKK